MEDVKSISERNQQNQQVFKRAGIDPCNYGESFGASFMKMFERTKIPEQELNKARDLLSTFPEGSAKEAVKRIEEVLNG